MRSQYGVVRVGARVLAALAAISLIPSFSVQAQDDQSPVALGRAEYVVTTGCGPTAVRLSLAATSPTLAVPDTGDVPASVVGVDDTTAGALDDFFSATVEAGGRAIVLAIGKEPQPESEPAPDRDECVHFLPGPGPYAVTIDVEAVNVATDGGEVTMTAATVTVTLELTAATLNGSTKLDIEQDVFCPLICFDVPDSASGSVTVAESSRRATAFAVRVGRTIDPTSEERGDSDVEASLAENDLVIAAGGQREVAIEVGGELGEIGATSATIQIVSDTASAPMEVAVTVTRRQHWRTYAVMVALGVLLGLLVRTVITHLISKGERRQAAEGALAEIDRAWKESPDATLRGAIASAHTELREKLTNATTMKQVTDAVAAARADVVSARKAQEARLVSAVNTRDVLSSEIEATVPFTQEIGVDLVGVRQGLAAIDAAIADGDATKAGELVGQQQTVLRATVSTKAQAWSEAVHGSLEKLMTTSCVERLPERTQAALKPHRAALDPRLDELRAGQASVSELRGLLGTAIVNVRSIVGVLHQLVQEIKVVHAALSSRWGFPESERVKEAVTVDVNDGTAIEQLAAMVGAVCDGSLAIKDFLSAGAVPAQHCEQFDDLVIAGNYVEIARLAGDPVRVLGDGPGADALGAIPGLTGGRSTPSAVDQARAIDSELPPASLEGLSETGTNALRAIRWLAMFAFVVIGAVLILPDVMVGTRVQLLGVFAWAFSLDLAYAGLAKAAQGLGKAPAVG